MARPLPRGKAGLGPRARRSQERRLIGHRMQPKGGTMTTPVQHVRWDDIPKEQLNDLLARRLVTGERIMLAHVYLKKGCLVPRHSHENEQFTYVLQGALQLWLGEDEAEEYIVRSGEVLTIPANLPHKAFALEDTLDVDVFSPPRQDWLAGTDHYLRGR
jgi:unsaturated pyranuronate lyase